MEPVTVTDDPLGPVVGLRDIADAPPTLNGDQAYALPLVADMVCNPVVEEAGIVTAAEKAPAAVVVTVAGVVDDATPSKLMITVAVGG